MNELELMTLLRDEVPLSAGTEVERVVLTAIREPATDARLRPRVRAPLTVRPRGRGGPRRPAPRPVLAGALALALCAGAAAGVAVSRNHAPAYQRPQVIAWQGRPAAPWPSVPSFGRARTEAQLIDYVTRVAAVSPDRAPSPHDWVVVKVEAALSSKGGGGFMFGPPDERQVTLQWSRVDGCAVTSSIIVPANLPPAKTLSGRLTINPKMCDQGDLAGWKSISYQYLNSLPTDPAALESVILASNPPGGYLPTRTAAIFDAIDHLLADGELWGAVIPQKLSAALYRILGELPGVRFESDTDLAGRKGLGFYVVTEGYIKQELVIDPLTYTYMGFKDVAIKDHWSTGTDGTRYVKKGQVLGWEALLGSAVVQRPGQLP
jgi:hypothetical protein